MLPAQPLAGNSSQSMLSSKRSGGARGGAKSARKRSTAAKAVHPSPLRQEATPARPSSTHQDTTARKLTFVTEAQQHQVVSERSCLDQSTPPRQRQQCSTPTPIAPTPSTVRHVPPPGLSLTGAATPYMQRYLAVKLKEAQQRIEALEAGEPSAAPPAMPDVVVKLQGKVQWLLAENERLRDALACAVAKASPGRGSSIAASQLARRMLADALKGKRAKRPGGMPDLIIRAGKHSPRQTFNTPGSLPGTPATQAQSCSGLSFHSPGTPPTRSTQGSPAETLRHPAVTPGIFFSSLASASPAGVAAVARAGSRAHLTGLVRARAAASPCPALPPKLSFIERAFQAAGSGDASTLQCLLDEGLCPDVMDAQGATLLVTAAGGGSADCVHALLQAGADMALHAGGATNTSALKAAVSGNHLEAARLLIQAGAPW